MGKPSEEFQRFDSLMEQVLAVPKATISERIAAHKRQADKNPKKPGPKPASRRKKAR